jgi:hypothetical protein
MKPMEKTGRRIIGYASIEYLEGDLSKEQTLVWTKD